MTIDKMINEIINEVRYTHSLTGKKKLNDNVMKVMANTPRELFVPEYLRDLAFENGPLPIGHGQSISQPYIVALMTDILELQVDHTVLEIGTGSGYQAAILSSLCKKVYTVERINELNVISKKRFKELGYDNIETRVGNGYEGWKEHAPYDRIIVTAAAQHIPAPLIKQLKPGGRLVLPIGHMSLHQELIVVNKDHNNKITTQSILGVSFVPLINDPVRKHGVTIH
ncbi:MAG: protein-L-isoaspartate(D-aspartate) O-methyltransferase [Gammaproteobacteria bacterium]|nr:protein-L-isoaspartate(D-aspartate) O-methyltransferase [Gammaproteobacteria bacterium]